MPPRPAHLRSDKRPNSQGIDTSFTDHRTIEDCLFALDDLLKSGPVSRQDISTGRQDQKTILRRSATSVKVAFKQLREARASRETFIREHDLASRHGSSGFRRGRDSLLVDKPKRTPNWQPKSLDQVSSSTVNSSSHRKLDMTLLHLARAQTPQYPYDANIGLVKEAMAEPVEAGPGPASRDAMLEPFHAAGWEKQGAREEDR